jgi:uncharacterized protein YbgA (DUF1722 family)/uncharacterized protein YbbK (DUF523 family)
VGAPLRIGVSTCLLGEKVRFDGGHKHDRWLTDVLGQYVEFVPVCPEVEIGLGTPRPAIRLEGTGTRIRLVSPKLGLDLTPRMQAWAQRRSAALEGESLCGYVFKKDSPSCGLERVRVHEPGGAVARHGRGLFAAAITERFPHLPVEEEGRLCDARLRENFVTRVFAAARWLDLERAGMTRAGLFRFHERHKYVLMAHSQAGLRRLGHLLGSADRRQDADLLARRYRAEFTPVMQRIPSPKNHTNVLQHLIGSFSQDLDAGDRRELTGMIEEYRLGRLPLVVPLTLIRHYARRLQVSYLLDQVYLNPHPSELLLLNHV